MAEEDSDQAPILGDGEGAQILFEHPAGHYGDGFVRRARGDIGGHDLTGGESLGSLLPVVAMFGYGVVDEVSQMMAAYRKGTLLDR